MLEEGKVTKEEIVSKYKNIVGTSTITSVDNVVCRNIDEIIMIINTIFSGDIRKQPWSIVEGALDVLLLMCEYVLVDENFVGTVIKKLLEYYEVLSDEEVNYLYLYIKRLLERCNYNIEKLGEEYLIRYKELEKHFHRI